ncbi:MAG: hypothetical protein AAFY72_14245, partial [Cyanobacteria bacterium J06649_4]
AFGPTQPGPNDWTNAITAEGDIAPGNDTEMVALNSDGLSINPNGQSTLWLRIQQSVNVLNERFVVDNISVISGS